MRCRLPKNKKGFSLIELLLYIAISATILLAVSVLIYLVLETRTKNQTIAEVEQQGEQVMELVTQILRNSQSINSPSPGTSAGSLFIAVADTEKNPTIFDFSAGTARIKEGASEAIALTSNRVTVLNLNFRNLSRTGTPGVIRVQFTLSYVNPAGIYKYDYSKTFFGTASLR